MEFLSSGKCRPVVPQAYYGMNLRSLGQLTRRRKELFQDGFRHVLKALAQRVRGCLSEVLEASADVILSYHEWFEHEAGAENRKK